MAWPLYWRTSEWVYIVFHKYFRDGNCSYLRLAPIMKLNLKSPVNTHKGKRIAYISLSWTTWVHGRSLYPSKTYEWSLGGIGSTPISTSSSVYPVWKILHKLLLVTENKAQITTYEFRTIVRSTPRTRSGISKQNPDFARLDYTLYQRLSIQIFLPFNVTI